MEGLKFDKEKPDWSLLNLEIMEGVVRALTQGAKKYHRENWRLVPDGKNRYFAAALRHLKAWQSGERKDEESGENPLAHCICCLIFLMGITAEEDKKVEKEKTENRAKRVVGIRLRSERGGIAC